MSTNAIGIHLGTSHACVGIFRDGNVEIIADEQENRSTRCCVAFMDDELLVGNVAKNQLVLNPQNTVFDAKRLIGRRFDDTTVQQDMKLWPFTVVNEHTKPKIRVEFKGEQKSFFPEEISSMVLSKMKEIAETHLDETVSKAVITVPALFSDSQLQATKDAATMAGFAEIELISTPEAAALAHGLQERNTKRNVLIFRLGGGTLEVSALSTGNGATQILASAEDVHLGGEDLDNRLLSHFIQEFKRKHNKDLSGDMRAVRRLKAACERAKIALSGSNEATLDIDSLFDDIDFCSQINRAKLDELCDVLFKSTLEPIKRVLREAGLNTSDIDELVLVGGSSRILKIQKLVSDFFRGTKLTKMPNPEEALACGAAIRAASIGEAA